MEINKSIKKRLKNQKKVDILFCGLVRTPERLIKSISEMSELRKEGFIDEIVFSTWKGEVQKYPEIYEFFKKNKVKILENEEPEERGVASIFCQMKSMEMGLNSIKNNKFVLKLRADMYVNKKFLKKLFSEKNDLLKITKNLPKGNVFKYKIWVHFYELKTPFLIGDCGLFGLNEDLKKLINYEKSYDTKLQITQIRHVEHIRRFIHPFINDYPILRETVSKHVKTGHTRTIFIRFFLRIFSINFFKLKNIKLVSKLNQINNFRIIKNRLKDDHFLESLAAYYSILYSHFYVDGNTMENQIELRRFVDIPMIEIDSKNFDNNFSKGSIIKMGFDMSFVYNMKFLENLFNNRLEKTELSERLIKAIDKFYSSN